jgi:soluble lytic murein transglycosylase
VLRIGLSIALWAAHGAAAPATPVSSLARGFAAYRAGEYHEAVKGLRAALAEKVRNDEWAAFLLGESEFYDGDYAAARAAFERAARAHGGRVAAMAPFRIADCLWMQGDHAAAAKAYARLLKKITPTTGDVALGRFRIAEESSARDPAGAKKQLLAIAREFPAHPLGDEALRRTGTPGTPARKEAPNPAATVAAETPPAAPPGLSVSDRLRRAESLTKDRHWDEALAELAALPATLPAEQAAERDYQIGMTKFHMRRDYAKAGELLLATVPHLSGDKAASAAFHGARALSRVDRDDEAIAGYRKVVAQFPHARFAAEAQYLSGWLEYNRGRFKESLPALQATLDHFGGSAFADDAAWCLAFAHFLLGDAAEATAALERYARIPATGITDAERGDRVAYWRARFRDKLAPKDSPKNGASPGKAEALEGYRALARRAPLSFYGLLARARLREAGQEEPLVLPPRKTAGVAPAKPARDPVVARAEELAEAGMDVEAGDEIERDEKGVLQRAGGEKAAGWLLGLYHRAGDYHRAYHFVESHDTGALAADPHADEGVRVFWEAAFPRAYAPLVDRYGPPAGNPELYLYAIMRKESGFDPHDVSYADARGLLQMIPPTSARVAEKAGEPFYPDLLYDPEVNVRLGAIYIGSLYKKFGGEVPLAAGAYNAGPRAMARWCTQHGTHPTDEFVELVAFAQTREYVKRVTSLYAKYRFLYGPKPYEIPLVLNTKVAPDGPDY